MTRSPHVQFARNVLCGLSVAAALGCFQVAHAGYAQATPPAGWSAGGGAGGAFTGTKAANGATFLSSSVTTNASLNVGGRAVSIPATMRFAANAPRLAAAAVMMNPYVRTAAAVAGWLGLAGLVYDQASGLWTKPDTSYPVSDGYEYQAIFHPNTPGPWLSSALEACKAAVTAYGMFGSVFYSFNGVMCTLKRTAPGWGDTVSTSVGKRTATSCPSGWYVTPAGCVQTPQPKTVTQQEGIDELIKHPMPAQVPRHIPEPLPVELPEYQPMFIPTGNPVPNPSYNPSQPVSPSNQPFVQPGVKVEPAPSPSAPWQVDVKPVNRPTESPTGSPEPTTEPGTDTPREDGKEDRDFCDKHPESLACTELDTPEGEIPKSTFEVSYSIENSWGNGSCPSDKYATIAGRSIKVYDWAQTCDYVATHVRPILYVLTGIGVLLMLYPWKS